MTSENDQLIVTKAANSPYGTVISNPLVFTIQELQTKIIQLQQEITDDPNNPMKSDGGVFQFVNTTDLSEITMISEQNGGKTLISLDGNGTESQITLPKTTVTTNVSVNGTQTFNSPFIFYTTTTQGSQPTNVSTGLTYVNAYMTNDSKRGIGIYYDSSWHYVMPTARTYISLTYGFTGPWTEGVAIGDALRITRTGYTTTITAVCWVRRVAEIKTDQTYRVIKVYDTSVAENLRNPKIPTSYCGTVTLCDIIPIVNNGVPATAIAQLTTSGILTITSLTDLVGVCGIEAGGFSLTVNTMGAWND